MVTFYKPKGDSNNKAAAPVTIDSLDWKGQGVAKGKTMHFVSGALPGETVAIKVTNSNKKVRSAHAIRVDNPSSHRVKPFCPVASRCGGCQLQHIESEAALSFRNLAIKEMLQRQLKFADEAWHTPISGPRPAYRRKARLALDARQPEKFKCGFREQQGKAVVDIHQCPVLLPTLSNLIAPLKKVLNSHENKRFLGHVSLLAGDNVAQVTIKHTQTLASQYVDAFASFASHHRVNLLLEDSKGAIQPVLVHAPLICSTLNGAYLTPGPNDFVQVNPAVNQQMIEQAIAWLSPSEGERIADWFSGLGNFTLPIAKRGAQVQAVEGVAEMVQRAKHNAREQGIDNVQWLQLDLFDEDSVLHALASGIDKVLIDPSREGALTVSHALVKAKPSTIVYVSCNPSTFSRDAEVLIEGGYTMDRAKVVEMFPYTQHMEMMARFTRQSK